MVSWQKIRCHLLHEQNLKVQALNMLYHMENILLGEETLFKMFIKILITSLPISSLAPECLQALPTPCHGATYISLWSVLFYTQI